MAAKDPGATVQCSIEVDDVTTPKSGDTTVKAGTYVFVFNHDFATVYRFQGGKFVKAFERKQ